MSKKSNQDTGAYTFKKEDFKYKKGRYWAYKDKHISIIIHKVRNRISNKFVGKDIFVCLYYQHNSLYDSFTCKSFDKVISSLNSRYLDC